MALKFDGSSRAATNSIGLCNIAARSPTAGAIAAGRREAGERTAWIVGVAAASVIGAA